jgi:hypothetical protein
MVSDLMLDRNHHYLWLVHCDVSVLLHVHLCKLFFSFLLGSEEETVHRFRNCNIADNFLSKQAVIHSNKILLFKKLNK